MKEKKRIESKFRYIITYYSMEQTYCVLLRKLTFGAWNEGKISTNELMIIRTLYKKKPLISTRIVNR